ncbi:MAG: nitrate reductase molybdenum cofactor assembly chaperone [Sulfitobacter sp.]|nr:MAG: nitrate reductase molybdenum cofactor assembly chaperone [Sulfitobacter sp.]
MKTFKILGLLLSYPTEELQSNMEDLKAVLQREGLLASKLEKTIVKFMDQLATKNLLKAQEDYVALFDRGRGNSLYLFEHIHGESRDRGQAMVDLIDHYQKKGLAVSTKELPDYIPLFLEYLSMCEPKEAQELLGEVVHIVATLAAKLNKKASRYSSVFLALEKLSHAKIDVQFVQRALMEDESRDDSLEALDKEWEETPAFDGLGDKACAVCPSATKFDFGSKPTELSKVN